MTTTTTGMVTIGEAMQTPTMMIITAGMMTIMTTAMDQLPRRPPEPAPVEEMRG